MPNIEIHGFGMDTPHNKGWRAIIIGQGAFSIKEKIDEVMREIGLGANAITTIFPSIASTCDSINTPSPYIRISNTKPEETTKIIQALKKAQILMDTETLTLASFTPGDEMK